MDGDSYVGAWSGGARSGWGATYWNNGNAHEGGNAGGGAMHGQGLHFKWGDGAAFRCRTMAHCFERDALVRANGTFRYARKVTFSGGCAISSSICLEKVVRTRTRMA